VIDGLFFIGLVANLLILIFVLLGTRKEDMRLWPPPSKQSWQYKAIWSIFGVLIVCVVALGYFDYSTWQLPAWLKFYVALPLAIIALTAGVVAALQLGWRNTHGEAVEFIDVGLYGYSRNPQYICLSIGYVFLGICLASVKVLILLVMIVVWYFRASLIEEKWLEQQYGKRYLAYKKQVPRFIGIGRA